ncbi:glutathione S-transferase [Burkholderia sp. GAS332]|nr:glutathione S-transferase [Burkholderia sp. GAS332]
MIFERDVHQHKRMGKLIKLYNYELSGNCYKVRLLLAFLNVAFEPVEINFYPGKEHKSDWFVESVNPLGQIPVIDDNGFVLRDAQAILVYLASQYDRERSWYPQEPRVQGQIVAWLAIADEITRTASAARLHDAMGYPFDVERCRTGAHAVFRLIDDHLADSEMEGREWLAGNAPTVADIACFPYVALSNEGGIPLDAYPALRRWVDRIRHLHGFVGMPGIFSPNL